MDKVFEFLYGLANPILTSAGIYITIRIANRADRKAREDEIKSTAKWQTIQEMKIGQMETELKSQTSIAHAERHTLADAKIKEHEGKIKELSDDLYSTMRRLEDKIDEYFGKFKRKEG